MSNDRSVDPARNTSLSPNRTLLDGWGGARALPRERAQKDRNKAMHITLGEVSSNLKPAAVEVLRVLVDGCFPDKVRRAGAHLILRIDYLSVGTIAKRAHWCKIDERDAARMADEGTLTDKDRRSLLAAKRRVDRALAQLQALGLITRTRRAGGRSVTIVQLRAPFDVEEPGSTPPPPGDSTGHLAPAAKGVEPAARCDGNVVPEEPAGCDGNDAPLATETSHRSRRKRRTDHDINVATGATFSSHPLLSLSPAPEVPSSESFLPPEPTGEQRMAIRGSLIRLGVESGAAQSVSLHPNITLALVKSTMAAVKADKNVRSQAAVVLTRLRRELDMSEGPKPAEQEPAEQPDEERDAIVDALTTDERARTKATARFVAAGGSESDAATMSERFIDWAIDATRENGTLPNIVAWHRGRKGAAR